jgi:hypothetical protein
VISTSAALKSQQQHSGGVNATTTRNWSYWKDLPESGFPSLSVLPGASSFEDCTIPSKTGQVFNP